MSRHPLQGYDAPEIPRHFPPSTVKIVTDRTAQVKEDPRVAKLAEVGAGDPWYSSLVAALESGLSLGQVAAPHPLQECRAVADRMSVEMTQGGKVVVVGGVQVVVPPPLRKEYKDMVHLFHESVNVMTTNAKAVKSNDS